MPASMHGGASGDDTGSGSSTHPPAPAATDAATAGPPSWQEALPALGQPFGQARTDLLMRGFGLCLLFVFLLQYHAPWQVTHRSIPLTWEAARLYFGTRPVVELLMTIAGTLLTVLGARCFVALFTAVSMTMFIRTNMADPQLFPAVEFTLFALLPVFVLLVVVEEFARAWISRSPLALRSAAVDRHVVWIARSAFLTTMFFVTFHKLNRDFLDPALSCENVIAGWLVENWGGVGKVLDAFGSPLLTVVVEGTIPLAILWHPALGILYAHGFFLVLGLNGAPSTAGIVLVLSWSFFSEDDVEVLRRRAKAIAVAGGLLWAALVAASLSIYTGTSLPRELTALTEAIVVFPSVWAAALLVEGSRRAAAPAGSALDAGAGFPVSRPSPGRHSGMILTALATAAFVWNGMSPYLGRRFNYSFAMWSNLRIDRHRWNSLIVPPWVQIWPFDDHYVEIQEVRFVTTRAALFREPVVSVERFLAAVAPWLNRSGVGLELRIRYQGRPYVFPDAAHDAAFRALASRMHSDELAPRGEAATATAPAVEVEQAVLETRNPMQGRSERTSSDPYNRQLEPALFSTTAFRKLVRDSQRLRQNLHLRFAYRGRNYRVTNTLGNEDFLRFVGSLPEDNLFPGKLTIQEPQACFH